MPPAITILSVWIVNKAGGLAFHHDYHPTALARLSANEYLVLASTFQSVHALSTQVDPSVFLPDASPGGMLGGEESRRAKKRRSSSGIQCISFGPHFAMHCLQSPTGVKFVSLSSHPPVTSQSTSAGAVLVSGQHQAQIGGFLYRVWEVYADWVCKNAFQVIEMPIRSEMFEVQLAKVVAQHSGK